MTTISDTTGFPGTYCLTRGAEFCNALLNKMCIYLNIKKLRTSPNHPKTNSAVECVHQTLEQMITKLDNKQHRKWPEHLGSITHAYNSTRSQITGYSLYFLMMGRRPWLPMQICCSPPHGHYQEQKESMNTLKPYTGD